MSALKEHLSNYISTLKSERNLTEKSIKAYYSDLSNLLSWMDQRDYTTFEYFQVNEYIKWLQEVKNLQDSSIKRRYITIKSFIKYLEIKKIISSSAIGNSRISFKMPKKLPKILPISDIGKLLKSPIDDYASLQSDFRKNICIRNIAIIEMLYCIGLRIGELVNINTEDINLEEQTVLINGKGRKERFLYISSIEVIDKVHKWLSVRNSFQPSSNALFVNKYGNRLSIYSVHAALIWRI